MPASHLPTMPSVSSVAHPVYPEIVIHFPGLISHYCSFCFALGDGGREPLELTESPRQHGRALCCVRL